MVANHAESFRKRFGKRAQSSAQAAALHLRPPRDGSSSARLSSYRRLVGAFERIFGATIFFATDTQLGRASVVHMARFAFLREAQIWYTRRPQDKAAWHDFENVIVLSENSIKKPSRTQFRRTSKPLRSSQAHQQCSTSSCGCAIAASFPREKSRSHYSDNTVWLVRSVQLNIRVGAVFGR